MQPGTWWFCICVVGRERGISFVTVCRSKANCKSKIILFGRSTFDLVVLFLLLSVTPTLVRRPSFCLYLKLYFKPRLKNVKANEILVTSSHVKTSKKALGTRLGCQYLVSIRLKRYWRRSRMEHRKC